MEPEKNIETKLEQLAQAIPSGNSFVDGVMSRIETSSDTLQKQSIHINLVRRLFMKTSVKFAVAAVVLFMVFTGWRVFDRSDKSSVVWADVLQKVQQAKAVIYRTQQTYQAENEQIILNSTMWASTDHGIKIETTETIHPIKAVPKSMVKQNGTADAEDNPEYEQHVTIAYIKPGKEIILYPSKKKYMETDINQKLFQDTEWKEIANPHNYFSYFTTDSPRISLGRSVIKGIEVEGFESHGLGFAEDGTGRIWIDVKTGYPVQTELEFKQQTDRNYDFQWNCVIDKSVFEPNIPADYTIMPDRKMPKITRDEAKELTEGLKRFAQVANRYPENLKPSILRAEAAKATREAKIEKALGPNRLRELPAEEQDAWITKDIEPIIELGCTYKRLTLDKKDPAYYGKTVAPGDAQAVLLRWKSSDTTYKVIMGDLSVTEMSTEQLKQIEPQPVP